MKKRYGFFHRAVTLGIVLGLIGTAGLCFLGYQKAEKAESAAIPIEDLGIAYIKGDIPQADTERIENILIELFGDHEIVKDIVTALGDDTVAEMITESFYLPHDETISTAIAQKILTHRLSKAYSNAELTLIYCGIHGYAPQSLWEKPTETHDVPFLNDILDYLTEQGILLNDTTNHIESITP